MEEKKNIMDYDTVSLDDENNAVVIIDQTKLPGRTEIISLKTAQEIWDAIYLLQVRGAPAIGVAAAYGIYVLAKGIETDDFDAAFKYHKEMGCVCFENPDMGIYFISDPDGYWIEIIPAE